MIGKIFIDPRAVVLLVANIVARRTKNVEIKWKDARSLPNPHCVAVLQKDLTWVIVVQHSPTLVNSPTLVCNSSFFVLVLNTTQLFCVT